MPSAKPIPSPEDRPNTPISCYSRVAMTAEALGIMVKLTVPQSQAGKLIRAVKILKELHGQAVREVDGGPIWKEANDVGTE